VERLSRKDGNFWIPYLGRGNEVARMNPNTGEVKHSSLPFEETAEVHSVVRAPEAPCLFHGVLR